MREDTKLAEIRESIRSGDWDLALRLASRFQRLGPHGPAIRRAANAILKPQFYEELDQDVKQLRTAGIEALIERFSTSWESIQAQIPSEEREDVAMGNSIDQLNSLGFDAVRYPRPDLAPMDVILQFADGTCKKLGSLLGVWTSTAPTPGPPTSAPMPGIEVATSGELRGEIGVHGVINMLFKLGITAKASKATSMKVNATAPIKVACSPDQIVDYVERGYPNTANKSSRYLTDPKVRRFIVTDVLASKEVEIQVGAKTSAEAQAEAADMAKAASGRLSVGGSRDNQGRLVYAGDTPVAFGFASAELVAGADKKSWLLDLRTPAGRKVLATGQLRDVLTPGSSIDLQEIDG